MSRAARHATNVKKSVPQEVEEHTKTIERNGETREVHYTRSRAVVRCVHEDIIGDAFWERNPHLLAD